MMEQQTFLFFEDDRQRSGREAPRAAGPFAEVDDLQELKEIALQCNRCNLRQGCKGVVFGEGDPKAKVMLVGEGPGAVEDEMGRPFVGPAGQLLERILEAAGFRREEVYIANAVKCRPPGNRMPEPAEIAACFPYLEAQIRIIQPAILVCLGAAAAKALLHPQARITEIRGQWQDRGGIKVMPTYHPAALLRDPGKKRPVWQDFKAIRAEFERFSGT